MVAQPGWTFVDPTCRLRAMTTGNALTDLLSYFQDLEAQRRGPIKPSVPPPNRVVLFVDMLGFATLTETYPVDTRMLTMHDRPLSATLETILAEPRNPLTDA